MSMKGHVTKRECDEIRRLFLGNNRPIEEIADEVGRSRNTVLNHATGYCPHDYDAPTEETHAIAGGGK